MTLTQIYSQYVSVSEQLLVKEEENKRLNSYIDEILQVKHLLLSFICYLSDFQFNLITHAGN